MQQTFNHLDSHWLMLRSLEAKLRLDVTSGNTSVKQRIHSSLVDFSEIVRADVRMFRDEVLESLRMRYDTHVAFRVRTVTQSVDVMLTRLQHLLYLLQTEQISKMESIKIVNSTRMELSDFFSILNEHRDTSKHFTREHNLTTLIATNDLDRKCTEANEHLLRIEGGAWTIPDKLQWLIDSEPSASQVQSVILHIEKMIGSLNVHSSCQKGFSEFLDNATNWVEMVLQEPSPSSAAFQGNVLRELQHLMRKLEELTRMYAQNRSTKFELEEEFSKFVTEVMSFCDDLDSAVITQVSK